MINRIATDYYLKDDDLTGWRYIEDNTYCGSYEVEKLFIKGLVNILQNNSDKDCFNVTAKNDSGYHYLNKESFKNSFSASHKVFRIYINHFNKLATLLYFSRSRIFIREFNYKRLYIDKKVLDVWQTGKSINTWNKSKYLNGFDKNSQKIQCQVYITYEGLHEFAKDAFFIDYEGIDRAKSKYVGEIFEKTFYGNEEKIDITFRFEITDCQYCSMTNNYYLKGINHRTGYDDHQILLTKNFELDLDFMKKNRIKWLEELKYFDREYTSLREVCDGCEPGEWCHCLDEINGE